MPSVPRRDTRRTHAALPVQGLHRQSVDGLSVRRQGRRPFTIALSGAAPGCRTYNASSAPSKLRRPRLSQLNREHA